MGLFPQKNNIKRINMKKKCTWKADGWMERERSLLLWRSRYSRFRTDVRASPGMLRMEFFSRCSSTRLRGKPLGTTLRLLFDKSRHSRLLSWLPGDRKRKSSNQLYALVLRAFSMLLQHETSDSLGIKMVEYVRIFVHLKVSLSMPSLLRRLFCRYSSLRFDKWSKAPAGIFSSLLFCNNRNNPFMLSLPYS